MRKYQGSDLLPGAHGFHPVFHRVWKGREAHALFPSIISVTKCPAVASHRRGLYTTPSSECVAQHGREDLSGRAVWRRSMTSSHLGDSGHRDCHSMTCVCQLSSTSQGLQSLSNSTKSEGSNGQYIMKAYDGDFPHLSHNNPSVVLRLIITVWKKLFLWHSQRRPGC